MVTLEHESEGLTNFACLLTVVIVWRNDALKGGPSAAPILVLAIVAGGVVSPILGLGAQGRLWARISDHCFPDPEPGQSKPSLSLGQVEATRDQVKKEVKDGTTR